MKRMVALLGGLPLIGFASAAFGQSIDESQVTPPQQEPQQGAQPQPQPPPVSGAGQWVYVDGEGYVWVPADTTPYVVGDVPYVYLYTPSFGWGWVASPWRYGWGHGTRYGGAPRVYGPNVYGPRVYGPRVYGPHVYGPRVYGPGVQHGGFTHPGGFVHPGGGFHHGGGRH
jgi:hypothetical protein